MVGNMVILLKHILSAKFTNVWVKPNPAHYLSLALFLFAYFALMFSVFKIVIMLIYTFFQTRRKNLLKRDWWQVILLWFFCGLRAMIFINKRFLFFSWMISKSWVSFVSVLFPCFSFVKLFLINEVLNIP